MNEDIRLSFENTNRIENDPEFQLLNKQIWSLMRWIMLLRLDEISQIKYKLDLKLAGLYIHVSKTINHNPQRKI